MSEIDEIMSEAAPVGFRTRYRSEPGMIGHYPWTYADHQRRKYDRPECEYENLFTDGQARDLIAAAIADARREGAEQMRAMETDYEPDPICVQWQRGALMAVDCDIGTLPVQMLHDGLTECEWMREGGR